VTARPSASGEVLGGATRVFVAEAISLPTALITAGFLARRFGPDDYGVFTLTVAIVAWLEWTLASLFARAAVKLVADADDWRPAGAVVMRMFGASGVLGFAALWLAAPALAVLMHEPSLAGHLRLMAFDVPLFMLTQAHLQVLVGTGAYGQRAIVAAWRWTGRMVLIVVFVGAGFTVDGALAGILGASALELIVARRFVQPGVRGATAVETRAMWAYALPLFAAAVSLRLFDKLDLFTLKALGGSAALAGVYGAAQNLTIVPGLVALSVATLLLSTLSRALRQGDGDGARGLVHNAMRGVLLLFPFAGVAAGAATGIATLIFGAEFGATGPLLAVLIFGALAVMMISVASAVVTATGRATWAMAAALPVAPLALAGHLTVIPSYGASGAAAVTTGVSVVGALLALVAVRRAWGMGPPLATAARAAVVTALMVGLGAWWTTRGAMVLVELATMSLVAMASLVVLGELTRGERQLVGAWLRGTGRLAPRNRPLAPRDQD
jgi:O-antigen/teichoic acid export membrane protein